MTNRECSNLARRIPFTAAVNAGLPADIESGLRRIVARQVKRSDMSKAAKQDRRAYLQGLQNSLFRKHKAQPAVRV